jgi:ribosome-binding factor A|tara:strand:+ start:5022 stop:5360 length:339 start_codon:yes stop_codon:yes gene_type:complete
MAAIRQEKVAELIRRDLSVIFQQNASAWLGGMFISVTQVRMSPDLGLARVYLSFMAVPDKKIALEAVRQQGWRVRKALSDKIGKQVRIIPELNFYLDDSIDYYESINNALKK